MNLFFLGKVMLSAIIIALASDLSKKSSLAAALTLALPLTSLLALFWVHFESDDKQRLISLSWDVFWLVPPSLAFFPAFAVLIARDVSFWWSFLISAGITLLVYFLYARVLAYFGISL